MRYQLASILISYLIPGIYAQTAAEDCLQAGPYLGDENSGTKKEDKDLATSLGRDHVVTKVVGCEFGNGRASSVQVFYGVWSNGQVIDEVALNRFGVTTDECSTLDVSECDAIKKVSLSYTGEAVNQIGFVTHNGDFMGTGSAARGDLAEEYQWPIDSPYAFWGLAGTDEGRVTSLRVIRYKKECLADEKAKLGNNFSWGGRSSGSGSSSASSGSSTG